MVSMIDIDADKLFDSRRITLPNGSELTIDVTVSFLEKVANHFGLDSIEKVDDEYLKMFVYGSLKNAIDKAEAGVTGVINATS